MKFAVNQRVVTIDRYVVEAESFGDAIRMVLDGEAEAPSQSDDYVGVDMKDGMLVDDFSFDELKPVWDYREYGKLGIFIPSIQSVEKIS